MGTCENTSVSMLGVALLSIPISLGISAVLWQRVWCRYISLTYAVAVTIVIVVLGYGEEVSILLLVLGMLASMAVSALLWELKVFRCMPIIYFMVVCTGKWIYECLTWREFSINDYFESLLVSVLIGTGLMFVVYIEKLAERRQKKHSKLFLHEQICFDAWRTSLPENSRRVLDAQWAAVQLIQHPIIGAKAYFCYTDVESIPLFETQQPNLHVATVFLRVTDIENKDQVMHMRVFVHRGRFFSMELSERHMQQHAMQPDKLQVVAVENHIVLN